MALEERINLFTQMLILLIAGSMLLYWAKKPNQTLQVVAMIFVSLVLAAHTLASPAVMFVLVCLLAVVRFLAILPQSYLQARSTQHYPQFSLLNQRRIERKSGHS
jgi:hypothetical protein